MNVKTLSYKSPGAAQSFEKSLRETGFAVITDHPISTALIEDTYSEWKAFFASPAKHDYTFKPELQAGYFPFRTENAKDSPVKDLKEFYHYYPDRAALPSQTQKFTPALFAQLSKLGAELLSWLEAATTNEVRNRLPMRLSEMIVDSEETLLRILHYPPLSGSEEDGAIRAAAHEDINLITLLPAATAPGLEVKDLAGNWHSVECHPGMIVINAGVMLQQVTRGFYPSTTHRVVNPSGSVAKEARFSMPLFLHPRRIAPLGEHLTAGQYLTERLREIGLLKK